MSFVNLLAQIFIFILELFYSLNREFEGNKFDKMRQAYMKKLISVFFIFVKVSFKD